MPTVIVHGPQGSGKTTSGEQLAEMFGCTEVVDEWMPQDALKTGALHLTRADQYQLSHVHVRLDDELNPVHIIRMDTLSYLIPEIVKP